MNAGAGLRRDKPRYLSVLPAAHGQMGTAVLLDVSGSGLVWILTLVLSPVNWKSESRGCYFNRNQIELCRSCFSQSFVAQLNVICAVGTTLIGRLM